MKVNPFRQYSQSAVNWRAIKKIYALGTKRVYSPKPSRINIENSPANYNFQEIEKYVESTVVEITSQYNKRLQILEKDTKQTLEAMCKKVYALQQEIKVLKAQRERQWNQIEPQVKDQILIKQFEQCQEPTLINIEESQEEQSLLDSISKQKIYHIPDKFVLKTKKKQYQMIKSSSNCKKLFQDTQMKTQPSEVIYPSLTRQSTGFDQCAKDIKQQLSLLKHFIQVTNNIKIQSNSSLPINTINQLKLETNIKTIEIHGSKNEVFHLKNENSKLRDQINKLKEQLINCCRQLKNIKMLLFEALSQEQYKVVVVEA